MRPDSRRIERLTNERVSAYADFVDGHPGALLYHSWPYLDLIARLTGAEQETLIAYDDQGRVSGVLPMLSKTGSLGRFFNSLPYYGSHGGVLAVDAESADALLREYNRVVRAPGIGGATLIANPLLEFPFPVEPANTLTDYRIGQFSRIGRDVNHAEALMESFHHKTRNVVRKAQKQQFTASVDNRMIGFLFDVHRENLAAIGGRAKSHAFFEQFPRGFRENDDYRIWVARDGEEPVAALLLFYHRTTVEYYMPVVREAYRERQALSLLIFESMVDASQRGYTLWNWGGTWATQEGLHLFKSRWGTHDTPYTYYVQVNDVRVYHATRNDLLAEYPDFFVIPFSLLKTDVDRCQVGS